MLDETRRQPPPPVRLERYEVLETVGQGAMGRVVRARDRELGRIVALKFLEADLGDADARRRFLREARAVARIEHRHVVGVHDVGEADGRPFLVLDFVDGGSLDGRLEEPYEIEDLVGLLVQVARAIAAAHAAGIVHRDLKPANILLTADGQPRVADFGLALTREVDSLVTRTGAILGTPLYMAPEQFDPTRHSIDHRVDVYALGAILYQILTRRPPFMGRSAIDLAYRVIHREPVAPRRIDPRIPWPLEAIVLKAIEKDPDRRYPTAAALADDLERALGHEPIRARRVTALRRLGLLGRRHRVPLAAIALGLVAVGATYWWTAVLGPRRAEAVRRERLVDLESEARRLAEADRVRLADAEPATVLREADRSSVADRVLAALAPGDDDERAAVERGLADYEAGPLLAAAHAALGQWTMAYRHDPEGPAGRRACREIAAQLVRLGRHTDAAALLGRLHAREGDDGALLELLGEALLADGDLEGAHAAFARIEDRPPTGRARLAAALAGLRQTIDVGRTTGYAPRASFDRLRLLALDRPTLVLFHREGRPAFAVEGGRLVPVPGPLDALPADCLVADVQAADVDGDRRPELLVALDRPGVGSGLVVLALEGGAWTVVATALDGPTHVQSLAVGDLDGDGRAEAIVLFSWESDHHWAVEFERRIPIATPFQPTGGRAWARVPRPADLDGDGDDEILLGRWMQMEGTVEIYDGPLAGRVSPSGSFVVGDPIDAIVLGPGRLAVLADIVPESLDRLAGVIEPDAQDRLLVLGWDGRRLSEVAHHRLSVDHPERTRLGKLAVGVLADQQVVVTWTDRRVVDEGRQRAEGTRLRVLDLDRPTEPPLSIGLGPTASLALADLDGDGQSELLHLGGERLEVRGLATDTPDLPRPPGSDATPSEGRRLLLAARDLIDFGADEEARQLLDEIAARFEGTDDGAEALALSVEAMLERAGRDDGEAVRRHGEGRHETARAIRATALDGWRRAEIEARRAAERLAGRPLWRRLVLRSAAEACRRLGDWQGLAAALAAASIGPADPASTGPRPARSIARTLTGPPLVDGPPVGAGPLAIDLPARSRIVDGGGLEVVFDGRSTRHVVGVEIDYRGGAIAWEAEIEIAGSVWLAEAHLGLVPVAPTAPGSFPGAVRIAHQGSGDWNRLGTKISAVGLPSLPLGRYPGRWRIRYAWLPEVGLVELEVTDLDGDGRSLVEIRVEGPPGQVVPTGRYVLGLSFGYFGVGDALLGSSFQPSWTGLTLDRVRLRAAAGSSVAPRTRPVGTPEMSRAAGARLVEGDRAAAADLYRAVLEIDPTDALARVHLALAGGTADEFLAGLAIDPYAFVVAIDDAMRGAPESARRAIGERLAAGIETAPGPCLALTGEVEAAAVHLTGTDPASRYLRGRSRLGQDEEQRSTDWRWLTGRGLRTAGLDPPAVYWAPPPGATEAGLRERLRARLAPFDEGRGSAADVIRAWVAASRVLLVRPDDVEVRVLRGRLAGLLGRAGEAEVGLRRIARARPDDPAAWLALALHFARVRAIHETLAFLGRARAAGLDPAALDREAFDFLKDDPRFTALGR